MEHVYTARELGITRACSKHGQLVDLCPDDAVSPGTSTLILGGAWSMYFCHSIIARKMVQAVMVLGVPASDAPGCLAVDGRPSPRVAPGRPVFCFMPTTAQPSAGMARRPRRSAWLSVIFCRWLVSPSGPSAPVQSGGTSSGSRFASATGCCRTSVGGYGVSEEQIKLCYGSNGAQARSWKSSWATSLTAAVALSS